VGIGTVVGGKFRVERVIAEGGMGVVVAATHLKLDQPVAMKFLRGEFGANPEALARLDREAKAAAQLKSEHVARVLDVGVADDGSPYMVMEYLEGLNLNDVVEILGVLDIPSVAEYAIQTCEGLAEAHARGIIHRDIKPDNLFLVERSGGWRTIKILDFGISKVVLANAQNISTGTIVGSPCYMSPEQLRSTATVDHRTDIWSLGATLYEILTGKPAFDPALTLPELVQAIVYEPVTPIRQLRPEVPEELAAVIERCLAKDREARFASAGEVARALLPFAPGRASGLVDRAASMLPAFPTTADGRRQTSDHPTVVSVAPPPKKTASAIARTVRARPRRIVVAAGIWAAGALLTVALIFSLRGSSPPVHVAVESITSPTPLSEPVNPPETIDVVVRASPASAQITVDGARVAGNPFQARYPKDDIARRIGATAAGFEPKWEDVQFGRDVVVNLSLVRRPSAPTVRATMPDPPPRAVATDPTPRAVATDPSSRPPSRPIATTASFMDPSPFVPIEVSSSGGRAPLRPIDTKNPFP
jgi:serine/threonine-protein kinase